VKRTPLKRKKGLKRGGRLPRFSPLGKLKHDIYNAQREVFLLQPEHRFCEVRVWVATGLPAPRHDRSMLTRPCGKRSTQVHHTRGRGRWHLDMKYWMGVEQAHHRWITDNGKQAEELGYVERVRERH